MATIKITKKYDFYIISGIGKTIKTMNSNTAMEVAEAKVRIAIKRLK